MSIVNEPWRWVVVEIAVGFVAAYLARKAEGLLDRAAHDADQLFDRKLTDLYGWVKATVTGRRSAERSLRLLEKDPAGADELTGLTDDLSAVIAEDESRRAQLEALVAELERLRPSGVRVWGLAVADEVGGHQTGALVEGTLPTGSTVTGAARAGQVHEGGTNAGVVYRPGP